MPGFDELRARAREVVGRGRVRGEVYRLLADTMRLVGEIGEEGVRASFREKYAGVTGESGRRRVGLESGTDAWGAAARIVFEGRRDVVWRYGVAMRQAEKMQIRPDELVEWLEREGGVSVLWAAERAERVGGGGGGKMVSRLALDRPMELVEGRWVTVRLKLLRRDGSAVAWEAS